MSLFCVVDWSSPVEKSQVYIYVCRGFMDLLGSMIYIDKEDIVVIFCLLLYSLILFAP